MLAPSCRNLTRAISEVRRRRCSATDVRLTITDQRVLRPAVCFVLAAFVMTPTAAAQTSSINLRILDQNGQEIAGSRIEVAGAAYETGSSISLGWGIHTFRLSPSVNGTNTSDLYRFDVREVDATTRTLDFEWIRSDVTLRVVDQHAAQITGSSLHVPGILGLLPTGSTWPFPITDRATYPTIGGSLADGYPWNVLPSVNRLSSSDLRRADPRPVLATTTGLDFEWITSDVTLRVVDQHGTEIAGSSLNLPGIFGLLPTGSAWPLPITDRAMYPTIGGRLADGYPWNVLPSVNRLSSSDLRRTDPRPVLATTTGLDFEWITSNVTLRVVDQHGAEIVGSRLHLPGILGLLPTGAAWPFPITDRAAYPTIDGSLAEGYPWNVLPSVNRLSSSDLRRTEPRPVLATTIGLDFEWITSDVTLRVVDQHGTEIAGSSLHLPGILGLLPTGSAWPFPITDRATYSTIGGSLADGYTWNVLPSVNRLNSSDLRRTDPRPVLATTTGLEFEWITSDVTLRVVDQHAQDIAGSMVGIIGVFSHVPTGTTWPFPITDRNVYPSIQGSWADGFRWRASVGIDGRSSGNLYRDEVTPVRADTTEVAFHWHLIACPWELVDERGNLVPASTLAFPPPVGPYSPGLVLNLPVTENSLYPTISGAWTDGYPITVTPGDIVPPLSGTFQFELTSSGAFDPASFVIGGNTYSLVCATNRAPVANAGDNLAIVTAEQSTTTVFGQASDSDGDSMTYRWLEGTTVLLDWTPVVGGAASLDLAGVPALPIDTHELTLEVSDGTATDSDMIVLVVGNTASTVVAGGAGVYQAGVDAVALTATAADFDGDLLSWQWSRGQATLASGTISSVAGGVPVVLPDVVLTTGQGAAADLGVGTHVLTLRVNDGFHPAVERVVAVTVVDTDAPRLAPECSHAVLWPPNHKLVDVTIVANATDAAGGPVFLAATITSTEDPVKDGSGNTIPDMLGPLVYQATGTIYVKLRAERAGKGPGRTYTITITATDAAMNESVTEVIIEAPHDRGR
jgi:hypothetical protein